MDCFKFLYSKVIECASLMAKLEWCVSDNCREKDNATSQVGKVVRNGNASNGSASKDPFDDFDDFSSDSIGTGEETDFEFEFDGRKETRSLRTIFQQFIGKFQDERELSATTSQSCGQGKAQDMVEEFDGRKETRSMWTVSWRRKISQC